jgi:prepilin-type N-terminal cleavage/methylation domain-containing protein
MILIRNKHHPRRPVEAGRLGFSLVELLVAMALIAFIMTILSSAFAYAAATFSNLKAAGDLAERLRGAMTMLRRDLAAPHFGNNSFKLSDPIWNDAPTTGPPDGTKVQGFFRIYQDSLTPVTVNGVTYYMTPVLPPPATPSIQWPVTPLPNEITTYSTYRTMLHFSVVTANPSSITATMPGDYFSTDIQYALDPLVNPAGGFTTLFNQDQRYQPPGTVLRSPSAEVAWWMSQSLNPDGTPNMTATEPGQVPQPLFQLRRRQCLIWPEGPNGAGNYPTLTVPSATSNYAEVSVPANGGQVNIIGGSSNTVIFPANRFAMTPGVAANPQGAPLDPINIYPITRVDDIVLDNVLSFDVKVLLVTNPTTTPPTTASTFVDLYDPSVQAYATLNNPAWSKPGGPRIFDTWASQGTTYGGTTPAWSTPGTNATIPLYQNAAGQLITIQAIQVILRLYDPKSQMTRQVSMVQAM